MANRLVSNVIIIDSAAGNTAIVSTLSNSASQITKFHVNAIAFWAGDTTGACQIACGNGSTGVIVQFGYVGGGAAYQSTQFGQNQPLEDLKVPLLTNGTAWIYLC